MTASALRNSSQTRQQRLHDLRRFYELLALLERNLGGKRLLSACTGRMSWPRRGVYFFFEPGEVRTDSGDGPRVVRVGTHALTAASSTTLWNRISQHRGTTQPSGGNHRGSIFRLIVGSALKARDGWVGCDTWGSGNTAPREVRERERPFEARVSDALGEMEFLWLAVEDEPGAQSARGRIERNAIALLSNFGRLPLDPPSSTWLGRHSDRERVRASGLWNSNHVDEAYDPAFLDELASLIAASRAC